MVVTGVPVRGREHGRDDGSDSRSGSRSGSRAGSRADGPAGGVPALLGAAELGAEPGRRATLVQFSSAFCQPCRATRRILAEVAAMVEGVAHIEIDAEERLDLVRALGIEKTPTVLVLDRAGRIVRRAAGMPRKADVIAALGAAV
ncbi:TlpA family protein disulfide reductase [Streptomyces sp. NPDC060232]|uniref:TlpA family protein disulfide reductase n=1 Tax=Streptomyces sp. NPDC060232 TaxID=3347079 RepID=UPI0036600AD3